VRKARAQLDRGSPEDAARTARAAAALAQGPRTRSAALTMLAWAELAMDRPAEAVSVVERVDPQHLDLYCLAAAQSANGRPALAIAALELARRGGGLSCDGAKLLVDLYATQNRVDRAVVAALENCDALGPDNCRRVFEAACEAGAYAPAAALASALFNTTCAPEDGAALVRALAYARDLREATRALHRAVSRLRSRVDGLAQARRLVAALRADRRLPNGTRVEVDRVLLAIEG
jgi:hypothetical protein